MNHLLKIARAARRQRPEKSFTFQGWPHGLNTSVEPFQISKTELARCVNYIIHPDGQLETRIPIKRYTTTATTSNAAIKFSIKIPIGGTSYELLIDENYVLYYISGTTPTTISTLEGEATIVPFKGIGLILDGSYAKYLDGVTAASLKSCYDDGTGITGHQFDNDGVTSTGGSINLWTGGYSRAAYKFTSHALDTGYTVPPTTFKARLSKVGSPTGTIFAVVRNVATDATMAKTSLSTAQALTSGSTGSAGTLYSVTFTEDHVTTEMSGSTAYYACVEYAIGRTGSYVLASCTTGTGKNGYQYTGSAYVAVTTKDPHFSLRPGKPPIATNGVIKKGSPFIYGNPAAPSYLYVGNGTYLDWSTSDGGARVGLVDDNAYNFPIGGIIVLLDNLFVYGKQGQPCLANLTGDSPSSYALPLLYQSAWTTQKTLVGAVNDVWSASSDGVDPLSGVQEYGDVRTFSASDPVADRLRDYWDTDDSIACYWPKYGLYLLSFPTYHRVLAFRTKEPVQDLNTNQKRYPCTEFEFYREHLTSASFGWATTGVGTNEYYAVYSTGSTAVIQKPDAVTLDRISISEGTSGSLDDHEWDYSGTAFIIRDDSGNPTGTTAEIRTLIIPQSMAIHDGELVLGGSDGFLYKTDSSKYKDCDTIQIDPVFRTAYIELPYSEININQVQLLSSGFAGSGLDLNIYTNGLRMTPTASILFNLPGSDGLTKAEATMDKNDATFAKNPKQTPKWKRPNLRCRSFQFETADLVIPGYPVYHNLILVKYRPLSI